MNKDATSASKPATADARPGANPEHHGPLPDEPDLIARCQKGETAAFNELVTRYRQRAFAMVFQMVRNDQDAWDLTQDGFLKAWRNIRHFRGQSQFYTWLYRILMNVTIDWLRRKQVQGEAVFDDAIGLENIEPGSTTTPKNELPPPARLSDKEIRARIDEAIQRLTPEHREVIVLREIEGLDYQEIADQTGITLGTVMSRLFYARKKLQSMLRDLYENL
ncbi:MAG: sigma-70 family RNA polymerase sigma factor [Chthoniobacteraceae bacterium]